MKKQTIIKIATLLLISLTLISCNPDNEGVFWRMSQSVPKVDVGAITLIAYYGTDLYASTTKKGPLQKYSGGSWSVINSSKARHFTTDNTNIYFAKQAEENKANEIWSYEMGEAVNSASNLNNDIFVISMAPTFNLVLTKENNGIDYIVNSFKNDKTIKEEFKLTNIFKEDEAPFLMASSHSEYVVSGKDKTDSSKYAHYFTNTKLESAVEGFDSYPIIAMGKNGNDIVLINNQGQIWIGQIGALNNFTKVDNNIKLIERFQDYVPYPTFIKGDYLYIQNSYYEFKKIKISTGNVENVDTNFAKVFSNSKIEAFSYLVFGNTVYVGTKDNGIYKIDALDADDKNWEADRY
jgi:hypothetical protein